MSLNLSCKFSNLLISLFKNEAHQSNKPREEYSKRLARH